MSISEDLECLKKIEELFNDENKKPKLDGPHLNLLEITGMGSQEIKHSNILGWFLENNGDSPGASFLKALLIKVVKHNFSKFDPTNLQNYFNNLNEESSYQVYREKNNIDLLIVDKKSKFVIAIENKIWALERTESDNDNGQLQLYEDYINKEFPDDKYTRVFIFLSPNLTKPIGGKETWLEASYDWIAQTLQESKNNSESPKDDKVRWLIDSYINLLKKEHIVVDKELEEACSKIWNDHEYRKALQLLVNYRPSDIIPLGKEILNQFQGQKCQHYLVQSSPSEFTFHINNYYVFDDKFQLYIKHDKDDSVRIQYWSPNGIPEEYSYLNDRCLGKHKNLKTVETFRNVIEDKERIISCFIDQIKSITTTVV